MIAAEGPNVPLVTETTSPIMRSRVGNIHMIGIGGSGMSGIAEVLINLGFTVTGGKSWISVLKFPGCLRSIVSVPKKFFPWPMPSRSLVSNLKKYGPGPSRRPCLQFVEHRPSMGVILR